MESSGRNGDDAERPAGDGPDQVRLPLERSPEGRFVVRSSSHPPTDRTGAIDSSGVHSRPRADDGAPAQREREGRPGRSTPAERPRKRKELKQGGTYRSDVRARCDTPRALPGTRISDRPKPLERAVPDAPSPSVAALAAAAAPAPLSTHDEAPASAIDEVTRRVRRPSPTPAQPVVDAQSSWRGLVIAAAIVALFLLSIWLFG